jgi:plasmid stabilization system protein ParE
MAEPRFLTPAEEEMIEAANFYEREANGLGRQFLADVTRTAQRASERPEAGQVLKSGLRRMLLHKFPFFVVYGQEPGRIVVVAVAHQSRKPGYWHER